MDMQTHDSEIWPRHFEEPNYATFVICVSFVFFYLVGKLCLFLAPKKVSVTPQSLGFWKNISVSVIHATISSVWALFCFYDSPKLTEDLISTVSISSHALVSFSLGYFVYDIVDNLIYRFRRDNRPNYEILGHHAVILVAYSIAVFGRLYLGYAVVSLLVELNSIFLHLRQLMKIYGVSKNNCWYRLNSIINLGTFVVFRITVLSWMTRWLVINRFQIPLAFYSVGSIGLAIITVINIVLLYRLFLSDFMISKKERSFKNE